MTEKKSKATKLSRKSSTKSRGLTKSTQIIELLARGGGASIHEMMKVTGWQAHSVRGFMAGSLKKQSKTVTSSVEKGGERRYQLAVGS